MVLITSASDESTLTCSCLNMNARYSFLLTGCGLFTGGGLFNACICLYFRLSVFVSNCDIGLNNIHLTLLKLPVWILQAIHQRHSAGQLYTGGP